MKEVKKEVSTFITRAYCDQPCGKELFVQSGMSGAATSWANTPIWRHMCIDRHVQDLPASYPRIEHVNKEDLEES